MYNAAIVNPPYRKLPAQSKARRILRDAGIEANNLYSAFVSLVIRQLEQDGQLVAITPRSFCNGPYFRPFRVDFLRQMSLRRVHVFDSRAAAFSDDSVLQENIVYHAVKGMNPPHTVLISRSSGHPGDQIEVRGSSYSEVVDPSDSEQFIHIELDDAQRLAKSRISQLPCSLAELGVKVSTGRVVDFRVRHWLRDHPSIDTFPLIYPCHFHRNGIAWPKSDGRKPNAIDKAAAPAGLLVPKGWYVLIKRFSAKEERRRIVATVCDPSELEADFYGFENHLNYLHHNGGGLDSTLAIGLGRYLNTTMVDQYFRQFSGHTQVNSTDLRMLKYPTAGALRRLGNLIFQMEPTQSELDTLVSEELFG